MPDEPHEHLTVRPEVADAVLAHCPDCDETCLFLSFGFPAGSESVLFTAVLSPLGAGRLVGMIEGVVQGTPIELAHGGTPTTRTGDHWMSLL